MSKSFYQTHYHSDIFGQNVNNNSIPKQKSIFNYSLRPKDTVTSLSNYMTNESQDKETFHIKVFTKKNQSNLLDTYTNNAPKQQKRHTHNHYLTKSQFQLGTDETKTYIVKKDRTRSLERFPEEHTAYQRKMQEFYGEEYMKYATKNKEVKSTKNILKKEIYNNEITPCSPCGPKGDRIICDSHSEVNIAVHPVKKINKVKHNTSQCLIKSPTFGTQSDFLKSNIFNDPVKELINSYNVNPIKQKDPIRISNKFSNTSVNKSFDMNSTGNEIGLYYKKPSTILSAKERKYKEIHCSYDNISREYIDNSFSQLYEPKQNDENSQPNTIKDRLERSCVLNGPNLYEICLSNRSQLKNEEIIHKYEIDNVNESDIHQLKRCFSNSGIHIYDTSMKNFKINDTTGKISVKIRENSNDKNFQKNFTKAKKILKQQKGLVLKGEEIKPITVQQPKCIVNKKLNPIVSKCQDENKSHLEHKIQVRKVDNYASIKKEKITEIPFNSRYKNGFLGK